MSQTFYLEYPPFSRDDIRILTAEEWAGELPANHRYEPVTVGEGGEYPTREALEAWVAQENESRQ